MQNPTPELTAKGRRRRPVVAAGSVRREVGGPDTEVEAYRFILDQLREMGWDTRNPSRHPSGRVWTQNQCLADPEVRRTLGVARPENIVRLTPRTLWVVEAKRDRSQIDVALAEAEADYARLIEVKRGVTAVVGSPTLCSCPPHLLDLRPDSAHTSRRILLEGSGHTPGC